jgi:hypothetical protein
MKLVLLVRAKYVGRVTVTVKQVTRPEPTLEFLGSGANSFGPQIIIYKYDEKKIHTRFAKCR